MCMEVKRGHDAEARPALRTARKRSSFSVSEVVLISPKDKIISNEKVLSSPSPWAPVDYPCLPTNCKPLTPTEVMTPPTTERLRGAIAS